MKIMLIALMLIASMSLAFGSTVTLTGTCYSKLINASNNYMVLNITNSGNGTATNLLIEPSIQGATTNTSILLPIVAPSSTYMEKIYLQNFTLPGSYVENFVTRYSQGSSTFITLFPCLININQNAPSALGITSLELKNKIIKVNISNIANYPITAQVSVFTPPSFTVFNSTKNITINKDSNSNISFSISTPQYTNAQFPIAVAVSYINSNVHYSTLAVSSISFGGGTGSIASILEGNGILFVILAIIIIIIALIIFSILKNKKDDHDKGKQEKHQNENEQKEQVVQ